MGTPEHEQTPNQPDNADEASPEEAEHEKRIDRDAEHGGLGEDVKPDPEDAEPSS